MASTVVGNGNDCSKWQRPFTKGKSASASANLNEKLSDQAKERTDKEGDWERVYLAHIVAWCFNYSALMH